ncbi:MAG: DoxX family protein, partial [Gemmatimonadetes bacterium]
MPVTTKRTRVVLWILQGLLAALFLFAGGFKLAMPFAALA